MTDGALHSLGASRTEQLLSAWRSSEADVRDFAVEFESSCQHVGDDVTFIGLSFISNSA